MGYLIHSSQSSQKAVLVRSQKSPRGRRLKAIERLRPDLICLPLSGPSMAPQHRGNLSSSQSGPSTPVETTGAFLVLLTGEFHSLPALVPVFCDLSCPRACPPINPSQCLRRGNFLHPNTSVNHRNVFALHHVITFRLVRGFNNLYITSRKVFKVQLISQKEKEKKNEKKKRKKKKRRRNKMKV